MRLKYKEWDFVVNGMPDECPVCGVADLEYLAEWSDMDDNGNHWTTFHCHHCGMAVRFYYEFRDENLQDNGFYNRLPVVYARVAHEDQ